MLVQTKGPRIKRVALRMVCTYAMHPFVENGITHAPVYNGRAALADDENELHSEASKKLASPRNIEDLINLHHMVELRKLFCVCCMRRRSSV